MQSVVVLMTACAAWYDVLIRQWVSRPPHTQPLPRATRSSIAAAYNRSMEQPDVIIAGAGLLGLSLALALEARGAQVLVLERGEALRQASYAAAGMLAAHDPENPAALLPLAELSLSLYDGYRANLASRGGVEVPLQTSYTLQAIDSHHRPLAANHDRSAQSQQQQSNSSPLATPALLAMRVPQLRTGDRSFIALDEHSLDPRQLAHALRTAVKHSRIQLREHTPVDRTRPHPSGVEVCMDGVSIVTRTFVDTRGAWARHARPRKGQMLSVVLPVELPLTAVVRTPELYIVPRITGPQAGRAIIGATVEDAGFDTATHERDLLHLRAGAASLLPPLAIAQRIDAWAGLRPATVDDLPIFGWIPPSMAEQSGDNSLTPVQQAEEAAPKRGDAPHGSRYLLATGLYRNGVLLAPAAAHVLAQLIAGEPPQVSLDAFSPQRFTPEV
jgi:glycine oxidase